MGHMQLRIPALEQGLLSAEALCSPHLSVSWKEKRKTGRKPRMDPLPPAPSQTLPSPTQEASQRKNVLTPLLGAPLGSCLSCCWHPLQLSPDPLSSSELCLRWKKCHSLKMHSTDERRTKCRWKKCHSLKMHSTDERRTKCRQ